MEKTLGIRVEQVLEKTVAREETAAVQDMERATAVVAATVEVRRRRACQCPACAYCQLPVA